MYNVADETNYLNVIGFFKLYDATYADVFVQILTKFHKDDLKDELLEMLKYGDENQKAYCAKFFEYQPYEKALDFLNKEAFADFTYLKENAIRALAKANDTTSVKLAYEKLNSNDGFEVLSGITFLTLYPELSQLDKLIEVANNCSMSENASAEIANAVDIYELVLNNRSEQVLVLLNSLINGLGEILPLYCILDYNLFEISRTLINDIYEEENSLISQILLNLYAKFKLLLENDEYTYDEDMDTKNEIKRIYTLLTNQGEAFWTQQKELLCDEFCQNNAKRILSALQLVKEFKLENNVEKIVDLTNSDNEMVICSAVETLAELKKLASLNLENLQTKIKNPNILAIINNLILTNKC